LNTPIENYVEMEAIFGGTLATGKYAMGSNEPLGTNMAHIDLDGPGEESDMTKTCAASGPASVCKPETSVGTEGKERGGKRRKISQEELDLMSGMVKAVQAVGEALKTPQHNEVHEDLYSCVMGSPGYSQEALMFALCYLLKNKAEGVCFVQMTEEHRVLWLRTYLSTTYFQ
jgi:hypothetical protein